LGSRRARSTSYATSRSRNPTHDRSVIRREIPIVEGQLYSARALQVSSERIRRLGFFEDVAFEPKTTEDPSQLDLDVNVVERPTGAFSFGAGFSSADNFIFTASLSQSNLFGRGYGANVSADIGGNSSRYFVSLTDLVSSDRRSLRDRLLTGAVRHFR
jgi:outer membrane protein insertion porin family